MSAAPPQMNSRLHTRIHSMPANDAPDAPEPELSPSHPSGERPWLLPYVSITQVLHRTCFADLAANHA